MWAGKIYDKDGKIMAVIDNGSGKGKISYGDTIFEGEFKNGIPYTGKFFDKEGKIIRKILNGEEIKE